MPDHPLRILITGASGYLGSALVRHVRAARPEWELHGTFLSQPPPSITPHPHRIDIRNGAAIHELFEQVQPDVVVHTAARMTGDYESLRDVNAVATGEIIQAAARFTARVIYTSTDLVFDGERGGYSESDNPRPVMAYGMSKLEGERTVLAGPAHVLIVRTSLIFGFDPLDPRTLAVLDGRMRRLYTDEFRCPIWVGSLCSALLELAETQREGVLHVAGAQPLSRFEFGQRLIRRLGRPEIDLIPALSAESGVVRPRDCTLDTRLARGVLRTPLPGVDRVLESIDLPIF
ncbi:MAG: SDR family oxidoreductase [Rudaea sp.]